MRFTTINCAVCNKPVDTIAWHDDPATLHRVITVKCHGETDEMRMTPSFMEKITGPMTGTAFTTKKVQP